MSPGNLPPAGASHGGSAPRPGAEFLSGLGHAMRSQLNSIIGFSEMLLSGKLGPPAAGHEAVLADVLSSARELLCLVDDLAAMARLEAGRVSFERRRLNLERLITEVEEGLHEETARKSLRVAVEVEPRARYAEVELSCFRHVLSSYLASALELSPPGGGLIVRLGEESSTHLRLEVEHSSQGMPPETLPGLFAPFEHVAGPRDSRFRGSGLRLALVRQRVEAQGGSVGVRGEAGQRIVFHALLPQGPVATGAPEEARDGR